MKDLFNAIDRFFRKYKREISINKLISKFEISDAEIETFLDTLYELEKNGKIYSIDGKSYTHVPNDFYLKFGILRKSLKNNLYINLNEGKIAIIPKKNLHGAKENDYVYIETKKNPKHKKQLIGNIVRVVSKPEFLHNVSFFRTEIKRDISKKFFYSLIENTVVYIPDNELCGAYPNDLVTIQINSGMSNYGKVVEIIKRNNTRHVLEYKKKNQLMFWNGIEMPIYPINVQFEKEENFNIGDKILVDIDEKNNATFIKKLDSSIELNNCIKNLLYDTGYPVDQSMQALDELKTIKGSIDTSDLVGRIDFRNLLTVTIDGDHAKDLDDAISLEYKDSKWYLYVHIADVTHYVKYKSALFYDALNRGTSVYPANLVFHMLNEVLANGVCSLNEGEDKLTKTCLIVLNNNGEILEHTIFNSIIRSDKRMTYSKVNDYLNYGVINEEYKEFLPLLNMMNNLSNKLQIEKIKRGYLGFEGDDVEFDINKGNIDGVSNRERGPAELMIENFMLTANNSIADIAYYYGVPFIFRNHDAPNIDQLSKLRDILNKMNIHISTLNNAIISRVLQKTMLNVLKDKTEEEKIYVSKLLLGCMNRAYYDTSCNSHYALALNNYATFTSPIRRFPDLLNHYILNKIINGDIDDLEKYRSDYDAWYEKCNSTRLLAERFEKYVDQMLLNSFVNQFIGDELTGNVVFINNDVICVKTKNLIYGYIKVPKKSVQNNSVTIFGKKYTPGSPICVRIDGVEENSNQIILSLVENKNIKIRKKEIK